MGKHSKAHRRPYVPDRGRPAQSNKKGLPLVLWLCIGGLLVLVAGVMLAFRPAATPPEPPLVTGKPKLQVNQQVEDFGKVPLNRPIKASFKLKNVGDKDLYMLGKPQVEVKEGCWPPNVVVGSTTIKPGQETEVWTEFSMHAGMEGKHDFRLPIKTNDPDQPVTELTILSDWGG